MTRTRLALVLSLVLGGACGSGGETAPAPTEPAPPPAATEAPAAPTEVPTTPEGATGTSSIVTRAPAAATGCPARDPGAAVQPGTVHSSTVNMAETLDLAGSPHRFPEGLSIDRVQLTVEPCALVLVGTGQAIWINGDATLVAVGDADHPITFDSIDPAAARGSWAGLYFNDGASPRSRLAYVTVEDAGGSAGYGEPGAIWATGDYAITMNEVSVRRSGGHGVSLRGSTRFGAGSAGLHVIDSGNTDIGGALVAISDSNRVGTLPDVTNEGSDLAEIVLIGEPGLVTTTQTWRNPGPGIRYHLRSELTVEGANGPILTVAPGTTLAMDAGKAIFVGWSADGALVLDGGTDATRITLTSARSVQSPGDWPGLMFGEHALVAGCRVAWTTIAFAGGDSGWGNPHGCSQAGAEHGGLSMREHAITAIEHVTIASLGENAAAIQRGLIADQPTDYTAPALGNDLSSGNCAQSFCEPTTGCPDPVPPCQR
jgi:hypothetical protein